MAKLIDLLHLGHTRGTAVYLLEGDEPAIVDCGPEVCIGGLKAGLAEHGLALADLRHIVLTHIHLDHAGAAGALVREHPGLQVHVSEIGAPHLVDPARLNASSRRVFGAVFDRLIGDLEPVPAENVRVLGDRVLGLDVVPAPGHARNQVALFESDGTCYPGDAVGCQIPPSRFLYPLTPPPEIDLPAWEGTLDALAERRPRVFCLPHFGVVEDPPEHLARIRELLAAWAERVRAGESEEAFVAAAEAELSAAADPETAEAYRLQPGFALSYAGLRRYYDKLAQRREGGT